MKKTFDDPLALFTGLLALATFCLVVVVSCQIRDFRKLSKAEVRAYLWPGFASHLGQRIDGGGAVWNISLLNTGRTAGIFTEIHHALVSENDFVAGHFQYTRAIDRGEIIPPTRPGEETPTGVVVLVPKGTLISCGYIVYTDVYRDRHEQAWAHRLHAAGFSEPLPRCYSDDPDKNH